jgi:bacillithiol system protein YtxJ
LRRNKDCFIKIKEIQSTGELEKLLKKSHTQPVFLIKTSPICPVSYSAQLQFTRFFEESEKSNFSACTIDVVKCRSLARSIAEKTGVIHQSPQALLFSAGECVWHDSHGALTTSAFKTALKQLTGNEK